jgi:hypothetical protein
MTGYNFDSFFAESSGGNFLPIVKYDARAGRMSKRNKDADGVHEVDITRNFKAIFDMENVEAGWIMFPAGAAPVFKMSRMADGTPVESPGEGFKRGVRFVVKLSKDSGGDVRELASNAKAFMKGVRKLFADYSAGVAGNPGKLPIVTMSDTVAETSGEGAKRSTNYVPVFEITGWVNRPEDLVYEPRNSAPAASAPPASFGSAPSTGSTRVNAPADEDDFG